LRVVEESHGVSFDLVDARSREAIAAMTAYFAELDERFPGGFDPGDALTSDAKLFDPPDGAFVIVRAVGVVAGCGGVMTIGDGVGEIKRMWIHPDHRGRGVASRLLAALEARCLAMGNPVVRLDTNASLTDAIRMYERSGYQPIDPYNDNPYAERWFEKQLR
jgi:GNAT superfamily N-acetyltransferase